MSHRVHRRLFAYLLTLLVLTPLQPAIALTTSEIYQKIDALRTDASGIVVDGTLSDWVTQPYWSDLAGDAGGDPTRDILAISIHRIWNARRTIDPTRASILPWFRRIAENRKAAMNRRLG